MGFIETVIGILAGVLEWCNPLSIRSLPAKSFMGYAGLGIGLIGGGFVYPVIANVVQNREKAALVTALVVIVLGGAGLRSGADPQNTAEVFDSAAGFVFRLADGIALVAGIVFLLSGESLRGRHILDRDLIRHPVVLIFAAVHGLFYLAELERRGTSPLLVCAAIVSVAIAAVSYAGVVSFIFRFCDDMRMKASPVMVATGCCVLVLLASIYSPHGTASRVLLLAGFPAGTALGLVVAVKARR